jgi:hypothetical protein
MLEAYQNGFSDLICIAQAVLLVILATESKSPRFDKEIFDGSGLQSITSQASQNAAPRVIGRFADFLFSVELSFKDQ